MSRTHRAAGIAAAILVAVFGTPSLAWEFSTPPVVSPELAIPDAPEPGNLPLSIQAPAAPPPAAAPLPAEAPPPPAPPVRRTLSELVGLHAAAETDGPEHECLANAIYFESKGEPLQGQLSVAEVVLNRARSGRFPASVCGVVKQRGQFSFVRGGRLPAVPRATAAWRKAVAVARIAMEDLADSPAERALFFHATRVKPSWRGLKRVATVGNHIFYR